MVRLSLSALLVAAASAHAYFLPPKGAITVGGKNTGAKYATLATALNDTSSNVFFIYGGNYTASGVAEQIYVSRPNIKVYGQTLLPHTYLGNTVTLSRNMPASIAGSNDKSATISVHAANVSFYNVNIENTYGKPVEQAQAIALSVQNDKFGGYGVKLSGWQDTLLANGPGGEFFSNSLIEGSVDFIFGMHASLWITESVIKSLDTGYLTASGRQDEDPYWYVIDKSLITGNGATYLGRPWRNYARVVFQQSYLGASVNHTGWSEWTPTDQRTNHTFYAEFGNIGPGAKGPRVDFAKKLDAPVDILTVLNETSWIDPAFL